MESSSALSNLSQSQVLTEETNQVISLRRLLLITRICVAEIRLSYDSGHGMEWNGKWNGMDGNFGMEYGRYQNGMEDFKNGMEDNLLYFHTNEIGMEAWKISILDFWRFPYKISILDGRLRIPY